MSSAKKKVSAVQEKVYKIAFAGGGTGGHIYPGIAVADELTAYFKKKGKKVQIDWIGNSKGMDKSIIEKNLISEGGSITKFHGIPCGKLRRYFSIQNFFDLFKIFAGLVKSYFILKKLKPDLLFSKGGFVSVPPCMAAKKLKIPYFTHECDFTPGLATRLNSKGAKNIFLSYEETASYFKDELKDKCLVTGNPVRPVFYLDLEEEGRKFLGIPEKTKKPVLLVLGGSLGAKQINDLIIENLAWLKERFIVVHQTGKAFAQENPDVMKMTGENYKPYAFIYKEMPSVIQAADIIISRSGANSLWECAVCSKPMVLIPLEGNGTRGDQLDNAKFFEKQGGAIVLTGREADTAHLVVTLNNLLETKKRKVLSQGVKAMCPKKKPSLVLAELIYSGVVQK